MIHHPRTLAATALGQPGIRALLLLLGILSLYAIYGSLRFYRDPLSIFFSQRHGFDQFYSATRKAEADEFLDAATADPRFTRSKLGNASDDDGDWPPPQICAAFITVGRQMHGRQYIDSAVGSFLANMTRAERRAVHLKLFFADVPDAEARHPSFARLSAAGVADEVFTYNSTLPARDRDRKIETLAGWAEDRGNKHKLERKTVHDYAYAMDRCVRTTEAPYIALFEGDILLADGWAARTLVNLRTVEEMMRDPQRRDPAKGEIEPGRPNTWLYLRLFNQERSSGWSGGTGFRSNNAHVISAAIAIPLLLILLLARGRLPRHIARQMDGWTLLVICGIAVPVFVWLFFASGKASLVGSPPGVREEWFGCCNQAIVYNRAHAGALAEHMLDAATRRSAPGRSDMLPKVFAWDRGLARISAYPMLAQHVGRVSAIDTSDDEARRVWSMAFEDLRPERLAAQHARDVRALFGDEAVYGATTADELE
ncbi:hypothetical protein DL765_001239 [Monosporascus sp. GIB2]|nr:hypothetical protein DL765_001239 [Monosporascus sp. GIB2]